MGRVIRIAEIDPEALRMVYAHAESRWPEECCGLIFGPSGTSAADRAMPCWNVLADPCRIAHSPVGAAAEYAFEMDEDGVRALERSLASDRPGKIIYHSHTRSGVRLSGADQRAAGHLGRPIWQVDHLVVRVWEGMAIEAAQYGWHRRRKCYVAICRFASRSIR